MNEPLKPCPFCTNTILNNRPIVLWDSSGHSVGCKNCGSSGPNTDTESEAIEVWNRRAFPDLSKDFETIRFRLMNHIEWWESVECRCEGLIGYTCDRCAHIENDRKSLDAIDRIEKAIK